MMKQVHKSMLGKCLILFLMAMVFSSGMLTASAANNGKLEVFIALDKDALDYDRVDVKVVSLGRTAKESIYTSSYPFFHSGAFMNYVYGGRILVNTMWFARGIPDPVHVNTLVLSRDDFGHFPEKELHLMLSPKSIVVK